MIPHFEGCSFVCMGVGDKQSDQDFVQLNMYIYSLFSVRTVLLGVV